MHASGHNLLAICCPLIIVISSGCQTPRSDRSVQVTQRPAATDQQISQPNTRLAYNNRLVPEDEAFATAQRPSQPTGTTVASINDDGDSLDVQMASAEQPTVEERELLEAFRNADPQVREAARRSMLAMQQMQQQAGPLPDLPTRDELNRDPFEAPLELPQQSPLQANALPTSSDAAPYAQVAEAYAESARPNGDSVKPFVLPTSHSEVNAEAADAIRPPSANTTGPQPQPEHPLGPLADDAGQADNKAPADKNRVPGDKNRVPGDDAQADADTAPEPVPPESKLSEEKLIAELVRRFAKLPEDADAAAVLRQRIRHRTLLMLAGQIDEAVEPIEGMGSSEQEFLRHQLLAMWTALDPQGHPVPERRWTTALPHMREATSHMAAATGTLEVRSLAFCTEVESFGRITPFASTRFTAGQQVILYSEVDSFSAERLSDGYETQFQGSYEVFDASGKRLAQKVLPADQQVCNNYRRDYFIAYRLHLPSQLEPGKYRMELTMEDLKGKKYGQSSIDFEIIAP